MPDPRDERDAQLERILVGGRETVEIVVVDDDGGWPARFEHWSALIRAALGGSALAVEHIGSTAVPGLAAKPILDMLLLVTDVEDEDAYVPALTPLGLSVRVREPNHRMLRTAERNVHVHVYEPGRPEVADYLRLRERLRNDAADRELYATTKRELARRRWRDMNDYADAKSGVIAEILGRARAAGA